MNNEKLIQEVNENWRLYGRTINKIFDFKGFIIDGNPLQNILETNSEEKIKKFNEYIKTQIVLLENI